MIKAFTLAALWLSGVATGATAQPEAVGVLTFVEVRSDAVDRAKTLLKQYETALRQHAPHSDVAVVQEIDRPHRFIVLEYSARTDELAAAEASARPALDAVSEWLIAPLDRRTHRDFADAPAPSAGAPPAPAAKAAAPSVYVIAHLDLGPPDQARGEVALAKMVEAARHSPGNLRFDAWQQSSRPNHFNIVAAWRSQAALDNFAASAAAREYRASVAPLIGSPYDERLYRRID
jgi:quinol monooxygenase YgiN